MGWYISPTVDTKDHHGTICAINCAHVDCKANREAVAKPCRICHAPIGQGKRVYFEDDGVNKHSMVHADCFEDIAQGGES